MLRTGRLLTAGLLLVSATRAWGTGYVQTDLVASTNTLPAVQIDPDLVNPWGIASSPTGSPFWVSDNGTGKETLYNSLGAKQGLVVTVPAGGGAVPGTPTGVVFNSTAADFVLGSAKATFIFATEDGTISAWNGGAGTTAVVKANTAGAVYKGLALGAASSGNRLYVANFFAGAINVFDNAFVPTVTVGSFTDPALPAGLAPFNVASIGGNLFVTYALQDGAKHDDVPGAGNGRIDEFDTNGNFLKVFATGSELNSPWGMTLAPAGFGQYAGDLLVGNFGNGIINVFDPVTGTLLGQVNGANGNPLVIDGLWGLIAGNGGNGGDANAVYFSAGPANETEGLLGSITVPEPASLGILGFGTLMLLQARFRRGR